MKMQFVLVAGHDYSRKGLGFSKRLSVRTNILRTKHSGHDLHFHMFDFSSGVISILESTLIPGGKRIEKITEKAKFKAITTKEYHRVPGRGEWVFKPNQSGFMSITNVYQAVRAIGISDPGTLIEFSIFSHSFIGGPILVNSDESSTILGTRDPHDFDARFFDFNTPRMDSLQLRNFRKAYHASGYNWVWGCFAVIVFRGIMRELFLHTKYRPFGLTDTDKFTFTNFTIDQRDLLRHRLAIPIAAHGIVELEFKDLKRFFCLLMEDSYIFALSKASERKTFGGLPGMSAEPDKTGRHRLSHVKINKFLKSYIDFYKNYLSIKLDSEKRNYAAYMPTLLC